MENYTVAFDKDIAGDLSKAEMKLISNVTLIHKKANPHITHVVWDERDGLTAIFFDSTESVIITSREKGVAIMSGEVKSNDEMVYELLNRA